jgi:mRNA-degrading endonuclease RelE of RelBE toxin-antitoxin system
MAFQIEWLDDGLEELKRLTRRNARKVFAAVEETLAQQPLRETHNAKRLRANSLAEWELRIDNFRVFYNVSEEERLVTIINIGEKKAGRLMIGGKEFEL